MPNFSSKLTKHDVEIKSKGTAINVKVQGKTISYDCKLFFPRNFSSIKTVGKAVKGATLGDTNRYVLMCTCNVCQNKIIKTFTKKAYHNGVVIVVCEKCDNNHLIADNLGWFRDKPVNIESLAEEKGDSVTRIYPDNNMKKILNNLEFVGEKHSATIESDRLGLSSSSLLQMIENIEPRGDERDVKGRSSRFGGKRGIN